MTKWQSKEQERTLIRADLIMMHADRARDLHTEKADLIMMHTDKAKDFCPQINTNKRFN